MAFKSQSPASKPEDLSYKRALKVVNDSAAVVSIADLSDDLLWNIFMKNNRRTSDVDWKNSPLATAWSCAHVCRRWREIIINSPSLWAAIIDLNAMSRFKAEWQDEIRHRTGQALLAIRGYFIYYGNTGQNLLLPFLRCDWTRIESLSLAILRARSVLCPEEDWLCLFRSAPRLRRCVIQLDEDIYDPALHNPNCKLFNDDAPLLETLQYSHLSFIISPDASWLCGIRNLDISHVSSMSTNHLLQVLEKMPCLEYLRLMKVLSSHSRTWPQLSIHLPKLDEIELVCHPCAWAVFLTQIMPKATCKLHLLAASESAPINEEDMALLKQVLSRYSESYFNHQLTTSFSIKLNDDFINISSWLSGSMSVQMPDFQVQIDSETMGQPLSLISLVDAFAGCNLHSVSSLEVIHHSDHGLGWDIHLSVLLSKFTNIETIVAGLDNITTLQHLQCINWVSFPHLKTIRIVPTDWLFFAQQPLTRGICQNILAFVESLRIYRAPVEVLDLTGWNEIVGLELFDHFEDLKVIHSTQNGTLPFVW
ncbi:hypothetical protein CVT26_001372 [Gymnopilus dilepis]|uniref:Uncharacterized protein n=1 Tax=Gymnopilus dilepis TaxID=231916 RepID=A0A409YUL3_9AGAR|nr:hypothetical protein CVT26_001372 [Gymnopilus dilepis]